MGGCQNNGPLLGSLNTRCRTILRTQKGTIILTTTHAKIGLGMMVICPAFFELGSEASKADKAPKPCFLSAPYNFYMAVSTN